MVKAIMRGVEKHGLVEIDVNAELPKNIRKIYGLALDKSHVKFFKLLGLKREGKSSFFSKFV